MHEIFKHIAFNSWHRPGSLLTTLCIVLCVSVSPIQAQLSITDTFPAINASNVPNNTSISITFDAPVDASSANVNTIGVHAQLSGVLSSNASTYSVESNVVTIRPDVPFKSGEQVIVSISDVRRVQGPGTAGPFVFSFVIGSSPLSKALFRERTVLPAGGKPQSVVAGDFNNDGLVDIAVSNVGESNLTIVENRGNYEFDEPYTVALPGDASSLFVADFTRDSFLELLVYVPSLNETFVIRSGGTGRFWDNAQSFGEQYGPICIADFDSDGNLDMALASSSLRRIVIFSEISSGVEPIQYSYEEFPPGFIPGSIAAADLDRDGAVDIVVGDRDRGLLRMYFNNGNFDGDSFEEQSQLEIKRPATALQAVDVNLDSNMDIVATIPGLNPEDDEAAVLIQQPDGTFDSQAAGFEFYGSHSLQAADIDGNSYPDMLIADSRPCVIPGVKNYIWYMLNDNGEYGEADTLQFSRSFPSAICAADYDGDGSIDIAITNSSSGTVSILYNEIDGAPPTAPTITLLQPEINQLNVAETSRISVFFSQPLKRSTVKSENVVVHGSVNGRISQSSDIRYREENGQYYIEIIPDRAFSPGEYISVSIRNIENWRHISMTDPYVYSFTVRSSPGPAQFKISQFNNVTMPSAISLADMDGDGGSDIVAASSTDDQALIFWNDGVGGFEERSSFAAGGEPVAVVSADFNGDGLVDLAAANNAGQNIEIFLNNGERVFSGAQAAPLTSAPRQIAAADINGDGAPDIVCSMRSADSLFVLLNDGDGQLGNSPLGFAGLRQGRIVTADFNKDGDVDIVSVAPDGRVFVYDNLNNTGRFTIEEILNEAAGGKALIAGNLDNDFYPDIVIVNYQLNLIHIYRNNADGSFSKVPDVVSLDPDGAGTPALADVDGDGDLDLVLFHNSPTDGLVLFLNDGSGAFEKELNVLGRSFAQSLIAAGDLDNDGDVDLAAVDPESGGLSILLNTEVTQLEVLPQYEPNICKHEILVLNAEIQGGIPPYSVEWRNADGLVQYSEQVSTATISRFYTLAVTTTVFTVDVTDLAGRSSSASFVVDVHAISARICRSDDSTLVAYPRGMAAYQWLLNGEPITGATSSTYRDSVLDGAYAVQTTSEAGCTTTSTARTFDAAAALQLLDLCFDYYVADAEKSKKVRVVNAATDSIFVISMEIENDDPGEFHILNPADSFYVLRGESFYTYVRYAPESAGVKAAALKINTNAGEFRSALIGNAQEPKSVLVSSVDMRLTPILLKSVTADPGDSFLLQVVLPRIEQAELLSDGGSICTMDILFNKSVLLYTGATLRHPEGVPAPRAYSQLRDISYPWATVEFSGSCMESDTAIQAFNFVSMIGSAAFATINVGRLEWLTRKEGVVTRELYSEPDTVHARDFCVQGEPLLIGPDIRYKNSTLGIVITPNPANDVVEVEFELAEAANVELTLTNLFGERLATKTVLKSKAGKNTAALDVGQLGSGSYFVALRHGGTLSTAQLNIFR